MKKIVQLKDIKYEELINESETNCTEVHDNCSVFTSATSLYLKDIAKYSVLTPTEEQELAIQITKGNDKAKEKFINSNLRLVVSIAKTYSTAKMELLDLIQEGNLGLLKAVEMFDYTKGFKFSTYATCWIKQAILRAIGNKGDSIRIPINIQELINKYKSIQNNFYKNNMRYAKDFEISQEMGKSVEEVNEIKSYIYNTISLNTPVSFEGDSELGDFIQDTNLTPEEIIIKNAKRETLDILISNSNLDQKEEMIIRMRFDFENEESNSLKIIAEKMGITQERVRIIEAQAMKKLRYTAKSKKELFN